MYSIDARLKQQSWGFYKSEKIIKIGIIVPKLLRKTCPAVLLKISYFNQTAFKGFLKIALAAMLCEPGTAGESKRHNQNPLEAVETKFDAI